MDIEQVNKFMKKLFLLLTVASLLLISCSTLKKIPTNTTGGIFSLNAYWILSSTTDNNAEIGTIVSVLPGLNSATVTSAANNTYCVRANDTFWKSIKSNNGGFLISALVNACNGTMVYTDAQITVLTNDQIRISGKTSTGAELTQTWNRASQNK
jgi:hypothetical protein